MVEMTRLRSRGEVVVVRVLVHHCRAHRRAARRNPGNARGPRMNYENATYVHESFESNGNRAYLSELLASLLWHQWSWWAPHWKRIQLLSLPSGWDVDGMSSSRHISVCLDEQTPHVLDDPLLSADGLSDNQFSGFMIHGLIRLMDVRNG